MVLTETSVKQKERWVRRTVLKEGTKKGGPGCWNCMFCVLVSGLDAGPWGDEVMYSKEQRRCKLCRIQSARALTATSLPINSQGRGSLCKLASPALLHDPQLCREPCWTRVGGGTLPSSWHFCFVRQVLTKLTNETTTRIFWIFQKLFRWLGPA